MTPFAAVVNGERTLLSGSRQPRRNAVVHNMPGGWVTVEVASAPRAAVLIVENTGVEIDAATAATLAEPFVRGVGRVRGPDDGSGLGLAIATAIARAHGGALAVASRSGGGLVVRVTLPAA